MIRFIAIPNDFIIKHYLNIINNYYNNKNYFKLYKFIRNYITNNEFINNYKKKNIIKIYKYNKVLIKFLNNIKLNKNKPINEYSLFLDLYSNILNKNNIKIVDENNKSYLFTKNELINIFKFSLLNQIELFPDPKIPKNPWTNKNFTLTQIIQIYNNISVNFLPLCIILFKNSQFNINEFRFRNLSYLKYQAVYSYVNNMSDKLFDEYLDEFLNFYNYNKYTYNNFNSKIHTCKCCIKNIKNYIKILKPIIIKYIIECNLCPNSRHEFVSINSFTELMKSYNLFKYKFHYLNHKKYKNLIKFNINSNLSPVNLSNLSNNLFIFKTSNNYIKNSKKNIKNKKNKNKIDIYPLWIYLLLNKSAKIIQKSFKSYLKRKTLIILAQSFFKYKLHKNYIIKMVKSLLFKKYTKTRLKHTILIKFHNYFKYINNSNKFKKFTNLNKSAYIIQKNIKIFIMKKNILKLYSTYKFYNLYIKKDYNNLNKNYGAYKIQKQWNIFIGKKYYEKLNKLFNYPYCFV